MSQPLLSPLSTGDDRKLTDETPEGPNESLPSDPVHLTAVPRDFIHMVHTGATDHQIASYLFLSVVTVGKFRRDLLGVNARE